MNSDIITIESALSAQADFITNYKAFTEVKARMELAEKELKSQLLEIMQAQGIEKFENDELKITLKKGTTRKTVDNEKLKKAGLYEDFLKESEVKASVLITLK